MNEKDPGTDPDPKPGDPGTKPEDPQKPGTGGSQNGDKGQGGDKAVQTGDTTNEAAWAAAATHAGATVVIAGKKRRSGK